MKKDNTTQKRKAKHTREPERANIESTKTFYLWGASIQLIRYNLRREPVLSLEKGVGDNRRNKQNNHRMHAHADSQAQRCT